MRRLPVRFRVSSSSRLPLRPAVPGSPARAFLSRPWHLSGDSFGRRHLPSFPLSRRPPSPPLAAAPCRLHCRSSPVDRRTAALFSTLSSSSSSNGSRSDNDDDDNNNERRCSSRAASSPRHPFKFETGIGLFAKRTPRPFPPPFYSPPSGSFSDALSTHDRSRDRRNREFVGGQLIRGLTNGDDAVFAGEHFVAANDGVGAWSMRPRGHAGLWSRLVVHFWAQTVNESMAAGSLVAPEPVQYLQRAYELTIAATRAPNDWQGTTTAAGALLTYRRVDPSPTAAGAAAGSGRGQDEAQLQPVLYVTNLGDSQVMVVRPAERRMIFKTQEQWHWFDCPRQLGTNSPDTPRDNAVIDVVPIHVGDVVLAMSDGVIDNLWTHEIVDKVSKSVATWQAKDKTEACLRRGMMTAVAEELVEAARVIAVDPFAESPFMEHAIEEGLASEGGKLDDISVVAAICRRAANDA